MEILLDCGVGLDEFEEPSLGQSIEWSLGLFVVPVQWMSKFQVMERVRNACETVTMPDVEARPKREMSSSKFVKFSSLHLTLALFFTKEYKLPLLTQIWCTAGAATFCSSSRSNVGVGKKLEMGKRTRPTITKAANPK